VGEFGTGDQTELREDPRDDPAFDSFLPKDVTAPETPVFPEAPEFLDTPVFPEAPVLEFIYYSTKVG